jgi:hypothetical protein
MLQRRRYDKLCLHYLVVKVTRSDRGEKLIRQKVLPLFFEERF